MTATNRGSALSRLRQASRGLFRERQLLLREADRVRSLRLSRGLQQTAAAGAVVALVALLASGIALVRQEQRIAARHAELAALRQNQADLRQDIDSLRAYAEQIAEVGRGDGDRAVRALHGAGETVGDLPEALARVAEAVAKVAGRTARLGSRARESEAALGEAEARLAHQARVRAELESELARTRAALANASNGRADLGGKLAETMADLRAARISRQAAMQSRLKAERRADALESRLVEARGAEERLRGRVAGLREELQASRAARAALVDERQELADKVARLEEALGTVAVGRDGDLVDRIAGLQEALAATERERDRLVAERERLLDQTDSLEQRITALLERQSGLVEHFTARTKDGLAAIENTVEMTGLDADALIARVKAEGQGRGGPFVPVAGANIPYVDQVAELDQQMERLLTLQTALAALPLTAPLDAYWISSYYGKRRDPYNGRWAMHEGLDLAAQAGSPVQAAAPGTVAFAGWKSGYGRLVIVDHGYGVRTYYGHLKSISVKKGQEIGHRARVGEVGSTGRSTGPHVHYEIRMDEEPMDPMNFLKAGKHVFKG